MPSLQKTESGTWKLQFYRNGKKCTKTFKERSAAKKYAAMLELSPEDGNNEFTLKRILTLYSEEVIVKKKGASKEAIRVEAFCRRPIADKLITQVTTSALQQYVDERMSEKGPSGGLIGPATVLRNLCTKTVSEG